MGISVREALKLKTLSKAKIVAGKNGLNKEIKVISVIECPESTELFKEGDFYITAFYPFRNNPDKQLNMIKILNEKGGSGLCVIDLYIKQFDQKIIEYADRENFPLLMITNDILYSDIITEVMTLNLQEKQNTIFEMQIDKLRELGEKNPEEVKNMARHINSNFKDKFVIMYFKNFTQIVKNDINQLKQQVEINPQWSVMEYNNGILSFLTFSKKIRKNHITWHINNIIEIFNKYDEEFNLGISKIKLGLEKINQGIEEAILAEEVVENIKNEEVFYYKDLGAYKFLYNIIDKPGVKNFHSEIINPIIEYDKEHQGDLLETVITFIENKGNIKNTSEQMFIHENTIRYRLNKIKDILKIKDSIFELYENLSLAVKIHKMI